ncbi:MAG: hypothetical protein E7522_01980 [Ruminococcaceae bacterium]|nr:hypothetical protein [Oscillospiraceae bacterium]
MNIEIISPEESKTCGKLRFSAPIQEEIEKATKEIWQLCCDRLGKLYGVTELGLEWLAPEIYNVQVTETTHNFLILKEIAELSREKGYPILVEGNLSSSLIAYLLGITNVNPLKAHYYCENEECSKIYEEIKDNVFGIDAEDKLCPKCKRKMTKDGYSLKFIAWGPLRHPKAPDFSIEIAPEIRPFIEDRLNQKFKSVKSDEESYLEFNMNDSCQCSDIGNMYKQIGVKPETEQYTNEVYLRALKNLSEKAKEMVEEDEKDEEGILKFADELRNIKNCDFHTLCRIFAYHCASFKNGKSLKNLDNPDFFVTREELISQLAAIGFSAKSYLDFVKHGVWSLGERKEKYIEKLKEHNAPEQLIENFKNTTNLWPMCACITRMQLACEKAWYELNFPELKNR